jgi:hypothetical protein
MPKFGKISSERINTCDIDIVRLFSTVVEEFDCTVIQGSRGAIEQMSFYRERKSKLVYPLGKHNPIYEGQNLLNLADIVGCDPDMDKITALMPHLEDEVLFEIDLNAPSSKSRAIDVIPYPVDWAFENDLFKKIGESQFGAVPIDDILNIEHNIQRWFKFGGYVLGIARQMKIPLIWGGDWDGDNCMSDQRFDDLPHFELMI